MYTVLIVSFQQMTQDLPAINVGENSFCFNRGVRLFDICSRPHEGKVQMIFRNCRLRHNVDATCKWKMPDSVFVQTEANEVVENHVRFLFIIAIDNFSWPHTIFLLHI